jgi:hypothetical protein
VATRNTLEFTSTHDDDALEALRSIAAGRGWCNVTPIVLDDDVGEHRVNALGLWITQGVPVATFLTAPVRKGLDQPSTLGLLHSRGRLGRENIAKLIGDAPFPVKQDHRQRGLLLEVPWDTSVQLVLDVMCTLTEAVNDYEFTGSWQMARYLTP